MEKIGGRYRVHYRRSTAAGCETVSTMCTDPQRHASK
jgi:hypothetical protein